MELDFSAETLPVLDHYLIGSRAEDGATPDPAVVALVGPCAGAYFGEVARRTLPGLRWVLPEQEDAYPSWRIEGASGRLSFNPVGVALEALHDESLPGWSAHFELPPAERAAVSHALERAGVREEDFRRLAVRHEVLEQVLAIIVPV